jgi:hypothetical protein
MASEPLAIARPEAPVEDDYGILSAALEASVRGRAFLSEHARRNRAADTEVLLAAIDRLTAQIRSDAEAVQHMRTELRTLVTAIRLARPDIDAGRPPGKVAMLSELVDLVEQRIGGLIGEPRTGDTQPPRPQLAVVPPSDEPELPIPSPDAQAPAMAVVTPAKPVAAVMPEVNVLDSGPPPASSPVRPQLPNAERLRVLAPIMALSEDERLALFS